MLCDLYAICVILDAAFWRNNDEWMDTWSTGATTLVEVMRQIGGFLLDS